MKGLYDSLNHLIGYFHDDKEINEYISFMNNRGICTKDWKRSDVCINV